MTGGEQAYLAMSVVAFLFYMGLLAYGSYVAPDRRPSEAAKDVANPAQKTSKAA